jgi:hypothetical protein
MEKFTTRGRFYTLRNPGKEFSGELTFDPVDGAKLVLELYGIERPGLYLQEFEEFICGITTRGDFSLYRCYQTNETISMRELGTYTYSPTWLMGGVYVEGKADLRFDRLSAEFNYLEEWLSLRPMEVITDFDDSSQTEIRLRKDFQHPAEVELTDCKIVVDFLLGRSISVYRNVFEMNIRWEAIFRFHQEKPLENIISKFVTIFQQFVSLGVSRPVLATNLSTSVLVNIDDPTYSRKVPVSLLTQIGVLYNSSSSSVSRGTCLFTYKDIRDDFASCVQAWFESYDKLQDFHDLYFGTIYNPYMGWNQRFLNLVQGLEIYHRHFRDSTYLSDTEFRELKKSMGEHLKKIFPQEKTKHLEVFQSKIGYWNEYTLRNRLYDLADNCPNPLKSNLGDLDQFARDVADLRNYLTHFSKKSQKRTEELTHQLPTLVHKLEVLYQSLLLRELRLSDERVYPMLERRLGRYDYFR